MFDMSNDSHLFRTREQLESDGWTLRGNIFTKGPDRYLPLYEAKMVHHFDHRWATYEGLEAREVTEAEKQDPCFVALPRYWVPSGATLGSIRESGRTTGWLLGWRDIARSTDERTLISTVFPLSGVGNQLPLILARHGEDKLLLAALTSFVADWTARFKVGGSHVNFFVLKQLAVTAPNQIADLVVSRDHVLELANTSWDMAGCIDSNPYRWTPSRRLVLRSELDAALFHLYRIERDDVSYIMSSFPIVQRKDEAEHGEFRTKRLILEVYDRMAEAIESGRPYETLLDPPPADPSLRHDPSTRPEWADLYAESDQ